MLLFKNLFTLLLEIQVLRRDAFFCVYVLSCVQLFAALWAVARQAPLSMGFPRQEFWSGLPFPTPGDLLDPGIKPAFSVSLMLAGRFFITKLLGKPSMVHYEATTVLDLHASDEIASKIHLCKAKRNRIVRRA